MDVCMYVQPIRPIKCSEITVDTINARGGKRPSGHISNAVLKSFGIALLTKY